MAEPTLFRPRQRRGWLWLVLIALALAVALPRVWQPAPIEDRLVEVHARETFGAESDLLREPVPVQALLLDFQSDRLLSLKAQAALHVYPQRSRTLFDLFGEEPEFRQALRAYGEHLIPPAAYFYENPVRTIEVLNRLRGNGESLTPEQRAWCAINFANREGQDFIGQFVVAPDGEIQWLWTDRITEGVTQFFTSGIRTLEARYRTDQPIRASDIGWAAVDAVIIGSAVKFVKAGRAAATTTRAATVTGRSAAYSSRLARAGRMASVMVSNAKWPAAIALGYVVIKHPVLLNDMFAGVANVLGVPPWAVQVPGWFLVLLPLLLLLRWLARVLTWVLSPLVRQRG